MSIEEVADAIRRAGADRDRIRVRKRMGGTLADGSEVRLHQYLYAVDEGRTMGLRSEMAPEDVQRWGAVLSTGNFEVPPELFPLDRRAP